MAAADGTANSSNSSPSHDAAMQPIKAAIGEWCSRLVGRKVGGRVQNGQKTN